MQTLTFLGFTICLSPLLTHHGETTFSLDISSCAREALYIHTPLLIVYFFELLFRDDPISMICGIPKAPV